MPVDMIVVMLVYEDIFRMVMIMMFKQRIWFSAKTGLLSGYFVGNILNLERESPEDLSKRMQVALWDLNPTTLPPLLLVWTQLKELDEEV